MRNLTLDRHSYIPTTHEIIKRRRSRYSLKFLCTHIFVILVLYIFFFVTRCSECLCKRNYVENVAKELRSWHGQQISLESSARRAVVISESDTWACRERRKRRRDVRLDGWHRREQRLSRTRVLDHSCDIHSFRKCAKSWTNDRRRRRRRWVEASVCLTVALLIVPWLEVPCLLLLLDAAAGGCTCLCFN